MGTNSCDRCGSTGRYVVERRIWDEGMKLYCPDCYADHIYDTTFLSEQQARLYAIWSSGDMTYGEAAEEIGITENSAQAQIGRIKEKIRKSSRTIDLVDMKV